MTDLSKVPAKEMVDEMKRRAERLVVVYDPGNEEPDITPEEYLISWVGSYLEVIGMLEDAKSSFIRKHNKDE